MGYFKSIAKQSGLRIENTNVGRGRGADGAAHRSQTRRPDSVSAAENERIVEQDEVVMIDSAGKNRPDALLDAPRERSVKAVQTSDSKGAEASLPEASASEDNTDAGRHSRIVARSAPIHDEDVSESAARPAVPRTKPARPEIDPETIAEVRNITPVETPDEAIPAAAPETTHEIFDRENDEDIRPERAAESSPREYFVRTAEILEGKAAEPTETTTILLRELQEWIADGERTATGEPESGVRVVVDDSGDSENTVKEPDRAGIIRIGEPRRREKEIAQVAFESKPEPVAEEIYELSIGAITVTIDGDSASKPVAAPPRPNPGHREKRTDRRSNRLGRHYL